MTPMTERLTIKDVESLKLRFPYMFAGPVVSAACVARRLLFQIMVAGQACFVPAAVPLKPTPVGGYLKEEK